jgi:hypothetical protein
LSTWLRSSRRPPFFFRPLMSASISTSLPPICRALADTAGHTHTSDEAARATHKMPRCEVPLTYEWLASTSCCLKVVKVCMLL